ncbi:MAG: BsuPI-related putative proteinase inhibitor, partial [Deinococcus sp.]|nr:BsuPI-related putative proteinase inhibitor [Deinococcus sp.]
DDATRQQAIDKVAAAGLPTGVLAFGGVPLSGTAQGSATGTVTETPAGPASGGLSSLPDNGQPLSQAHRAALRGPSSVRAGEANTWSFTLTNLGSSAIHLEHGACDVRFEVLNAAGEIVRPDPKNTICTMQLVYTNVTPGETQDVQNIRWEGKDAAGQPVPAGEYTLRAVFRGAGQRSDVAELKVTVQ